MEDAHSEHRSEPRVRTVLKAEIRYNDGLMNTSCLVRDLSEHGARLELPGDVTLPERFELYIEKRQKTHQAVVKRRRGNEVGVAFVDGKEKSASVEPGLADRVARLEAELAKLQELVQKMAAPLPGPH